jgi:hypothetical protein
MSAIPPPPLLFEEYVFFKIGLEKGVLCGLCGALCREPFATLTRPRNAF